MVTPARIKRQARDRVISIALAVVIGLIMGVGGWLLWHHRASGPFMVAAVQQKNLDAVQLMPHKALYGVTMLSARNGSQIIDIDGKMFFQMHQGCDAFITDHRFVLTYDYADTEPMRVTSDFSTVENSLGTQFDFSSRRRRDGELYQELRGKAEVGGTTPGAAIFAQPENLQFDLSAGTLFPSRHTQALIAAARAGQKFLSTRIFDGSDAEGPVDVTAVIGEKIDVLKTLALTPAIDRAALSTAAWKIHLAFFPVAGASETADYELSMILHENGVISDMTVDYQDFSVHQRLLALESLPPETCHSDQPVKPTVLAPSPDRPFR